MIHLLFGNVLYPNIDKASKIYIDGSLIIIEKSDFTSLLAIDIMSHPHIAELTKEDETLKDMAVYQTFCILCQRFSGKTFIDGKLVAIENDVFNLDGALFKLQKATRDTAKSEGEIEQ